jgi:hypothetical protein
LKSWVCEGQTRYAWRRIAVRATGSYKLGASGRPISQQGLITKVCGSTPIMSMPRVIKVFDAL